MEKLAVIQSEDREGGVQQANTCDEDAKESKIKKAEWSFVHKDFHQALHLANEVLQESSPPPPPTYVERVQSLQTSVFSVNWKLSLLLDDTIQVADRAGAIALQCIYATHLDDDKAVMLEPFLKFYSKSPISLDLLVIVIHFLLNTGEEHSAIELASETLHYIQSLSSSINKGTVGRAVTSSYLQESIDDLVWTLVTRLIPFCPHERYINVISDGGAICWQGSIEKNFKWHTEPNLAMLVTLTNTLDSLQGVASKDCLERCRVRLRDLGGAKYDSITTNCTSISTGLNGIPCHEVIPRPPSHSSQPSWIDALIAKDAWYQPIAVRVLNFVTERIIRPLLRSGNRERRNHLAVTILAIVVTWKNRHRLLHATSLVGRLVLKPLAEILDAVLMLEP